MKVTPVDIATRPSQTGDNPSCDRVDGLLVKTIGMCLSRGNDFPNASVASAGQDDRDLATNKISRHRAHPIELAVSPAIFDGHVAAFDKACFA